MKLKRPWLMKTHKNFFLVLMATVIFHLWCGLLGILTPAIFVSSGLRYINWVSPAIWGVSNLVIAGGIYAGLHMERFRTVKIFLSLGFFWCLLRFLLIMMAWISGLAVGIGPPVYLLLSMLHLSQTLEPPSNPASI